MHTKIWRLIWSEVVANRFLHEKIDWFKDCLLDNCQDKWVYYHEGQAKIGSLLI